MVVITGPTMVNAVNSMICRGIPTITNRSALGMKYSTGVTTATGRIRRPTSRSAFAGSRRYRPS